MMTTSDGIPTTTDAVLVERRDHTAIITINRPEAYNACNLDVWVGVGAALDDADRDPAVRAIVITGAGDKAFCSGADLKALARGEEVRPADARADWSFAGFARHPVETPTIAAVNGLAFGGGLELVLAADLAVASANARFALPEAKVGLLAAAGGAFRLGRRIPPVVAMEMLLTGEPITATRALELNLVNYVVPEGNALDRALSLASAVARNAPLSVRAHKRIALGYDAAGNRVADDAGWTVTGELMDMVSASDDAKEGPRAFAAKRAPQWSGS